MCVGVCEVRKVVIDFYKIVLIKGVVTLIKKSEIDWNDITINLNQSGNLRFYLDRLYSSSRRP